MAYSEELAHRIRDVVGGRNGVTERKMFGGVAWMVDGNMACGVIGEDLMVRLDRDDAERALDEAHVGPMEFTGRKMGGFVIVDSAGIADAPGLSRWVDVGADFAASLPAK
jgi:TfoX/Sxy family transcriptional regulator of competence genes